MKRILLIIAAVSAVLLAALALYVQSESFGARIRPLFADPLQEALGPGARFGRIKTSLIPLYLEVRDIVIPSSGSPEAVAVRRVRVYLNPFPLIYRTISIPSVAVLEPRLTANRSVDGSVDLSGLVDAIRANIEKSSQTGSAAYDVHVRMLTVRNGMVVLHDAGTRSTAVLAGAEMKIKLSIPGPSLNMRLASAALNVKGPAYREIRGRIRGVISYERGKLTLEDTELIAEDARITVSGSIGVLTGGGLDLKVSSRIGQRSLGRLTDLLTRDKRAKGPAVDVTARIGGTMRAPILNGGVTLAGISLRGIRLKDAEARFSYRNGAVALAAENWQVSRGDRQVSIQELTVETTYRDSVLDVRRAELKADDLALSASGTVGPAEGYQISLTGTSSGSGRSVSFLAGFEVGGPVNVGGWLSGPLDAPRFDGQLEAGPVTVRNVPFKSASGEIHFRDRVFSLSSVDIRHGESQYDFSGSVDLSGTESVYQARLDVLRSDVVSIVALFYERIPLALSAKGVLTFQGTGREFSGEGRLDLASGVAYGESFDRGSLSVELDSGRVSFPRVLLEKKGGTVAGSGWIGFDGTYDAHVESEGVDLSEVDLIKEYALSGPFTLDIRSSGRFSAPVVRASAASEELSYRQSTLGPARVDLTIQNAILSFSADLNSSSVALGGNWALKRPYAWDLEAAVKMSGFDPSSLVRGSDLLAKTRIDADGSVQMRGRGFDRESVRGGARFRALGIALGELAFKNDGDAVVGIDAGHVAVRSLTLVGPGTRLAVTGSTTIGEDVDVTFTGDANLSLLRMLYRVVEHSDGAASVRLTVSDEWSNPDISGELNIKNGLIKIRDIPQRFTGVNGTIGFHQGKISTEGLSGEFGGGTIALAGNAQLSGTSLVDFTTKAAIDNVTLRYPAGLTANVGGSLYYDGDVKAQTLSGEIVIRKARYEKRVEWKSMLVDFNKNFAQKKRSDIGWLGETQLNVRFLGKENILFESNLAKIPLSIDMQFRGTVNQPQVLGRVEARKGEVYFRKNVFKVLYASADFTDPGRINPTLDVRAETKVREYQIQLGVSGTADRAVVTFVSDPALTDSNILALLAIGRRSEELKGKEANVGVGEATSFVTGKFQDILESRTRSFTGLDRFQVDPYINKADVAVPRVTVGKEVVQDKVFMTYSSNVGATTPEQVFRIEYMLNKNMSLVGEQDEQGNIGADVKFRFEFR